MNVPSELHVALIGLAGALIGGLTTGGVQLIVLWRSNLASQRAVAREEKKKLYLDALWGLRQIREDFRVDLLSEAAAAEAGKHWEPDSSALDSWKALSRTLLEVGVLGDTRVHRELAEGADQFRTWIMSLDPEAPVQGYATVDARLSDLEDRLRGAIRQDLGVG